MVSSSSKLYWEEFKKLSAGLGGVILCLSFVKRIGKRIGIKFFVLEMDFNNNN